MSRGYVYILTNEAMPGLVKIGKTTRDPGVRAKEISDATGVPIPFRVYDFFSCPDCNELEDAAHGAMADRRVSQNREFFAVDVYVAAECLRQLHQEQIERWLEEFLPDHQIVHANAFVDIGALKKSAMDRLKDADLCPPDVPLVLYEIEGDEIENAIARNKEKTAKRAEELRKRRAIRVVDDEQ